jgi:hypothetical protein
MRTYHPPTSAPRGAGEVSRPAGPRARSGSWRSR